jgi:hypothetical protein
MDCLRTECCENYLDVREKVRGGWRKSQNADVHNLRFHQVLLGCVGHVPLMGVVRNAYKVLVRKSGGRNPHGRHRNRWDDIKINL